MNHYSNAADCPAMRGALANDIRTVARNTLAQINETVRNWEDGCPLRFSIEDGQGDVNINGTATLAERGEWRDVGDEVICVKHYAPDIEDVCIDIELYDDGETTGEAYHISNLPELERLADMVTVDELCAKMGNKCVDVTYKPADICRKCWTLDAVKKALGTWYCSLLGFYRDGYSYTPILLPSVQRKWDDELSNFNNAKSAFCARYGCE